MQSFIAERGSPAPARANVVIIGAGIVGTSVAYHLAQEGWSDIVLVEQGGLWAAGGSTSHAPGLVFALNASRQVCQLAQWSAALFDDLNADGDPTYHPVGSIEVATTPERHEELQRRLGRAQSYGMTAELLDTAGVHRALPLVDPDRVISGLWVEGDGIAKAVRISEALACRAAAKDPALRVLDDCQVTAVQRRGKRVSAVVTTRGTINCGHVVLCAGIWGPSVGRLAGVPVPLTPVAHQLVWTEPLPHLAAEDREVVDPLLRHQDAALYFRQRRDHYAIGSYAHEPQLVEPDALAPAGPGRRPADLPFTAADFAPAQRAAEALMPSLCGVGHAHAFNGLFSFTPDGLSLIGESTQLGGFWLAEAVWVTHAGGTGRVVAELMTTGESELDVHVFHPARFDAHGRSPAYWRARGAQQYREVYDVIHPRQPASVARGLRRSPFWPRQVEAGAVFFEAAGWERSQWYGTNADLARSDHRRHPWSARSWSPIANGEHRHCREQAGLFDLTSFAKFWVRGPGATDYLQRLAANDVDRPVGTITYTSLLTSAGTIECDLTITRLADDAYLVLTGGALGGHDLHWMRRHQPDNGSVTIEDRSSAYCAVGLWGPKAREVLQALAEEDVSNAAFPYMSARELNVGLVPVTALRISYVGELGWEIYAPTEFGLHLWDALMEAGAPHGLRPCGLAAYDQMRLEKGYRLLGADIDNEHTPYDAGLAFAVKLDKATGFTGQAALQRQREQGVRRTLVCLTLEDPTVVLVGGEPLVDLDGGTLGYVTSAGWGETVQASIAFGYVPVEVSAPDTVVLVFAEGAQRRARVVRDPLFDPEMSRLRDAEPVVA